MPACTWPNGISLLWCCWSPPQHKAWVGGTSDTAASRVCQNQHLGWRSDTAGWSTSGTVPPGYGRHALGQNNLHSMEVRWIKNFSLISVLIMKGACVHIQRRMTHNTLCMSMLIIYFGRYSWPTSVDFRWLSISGSAKELDKTILPVTFLNSKPARGFTKWNFQAVDTT